MKKYKYKFSNLIIVVLILGCVLAVGALTLNAYRFISNVKQNNELLLYDYLSLILVIALSVAFIVCAIWALLNSHYQITDKAVILKWGLIKTTILASDIVEIKLITTKNRLELIFKDESYFIVVIQNNSFNDFVDELRSKFPKIAFVQISEEEAKK